VLEDGMDEQGLICSPKTVLAAPSSKLAANLSGSLEAIGAPHSAADKAVDLRINAASGRRRARTKAPARIDAEARRWRRPTKLRCATARPTECQRPWATGALPQSAYGHQVNGATPGLARKQRRRAGHAACGAACGRSLAAALAATVGHCDPFIALRLQLVASRRSLRFSDASLRGRIRRVREPMGALQAALLDVGWGPRTAPVWAHPTAEGEGELELAGADDDSFHARADFDGVLQLETLERGARHAEKGLTLAVVSGGKRARSRRAAAGHALDFEGCARRSCASEAPAPGTRQCPANVGEELDSTAAPAPRALARHGPSPATWPRGAPASCMTAPVFCDQRAEEATASFGADDNLEAARRDDSFAAVYGDDSGGKHSDDPRL
ncbi:unnamed protein product, partial [Prorocentrum cordatum]